MIEEREHMDLFTEQGANSLCMPDDMFQDVEGEAESRLEKYAVRTLKKLGDRLAAKSLILRIRDNDQDCGVLCTKVTRNYDTWDLKTNGSENYYKRPLAHRTLKPSFILKSHFYYHLDLPHRWLGMLIVEYSGISFLSDQQDSAIRDTLRDFTKDITILLMERSLAHMQNRLNEEKKATELLRALVSNLSKELYCLSSISNAISQSHNVEGVLTGVLEAALPLLRAKLGVIYFPETGQCVTFQSPRSKLKRGGDPWLRYYFESKIRVSEQPSDRNSFSVQSVAAHQRLPLVLKAHLASQGIESVLEFSLHHHDEVLGLGFLGLQQDQNQPADTRLLMITLNMVGLFLEHISLMGDLERQVKVISKEKLDMEKKQQFLIDHVGKPFSSVNPKKSSSPDRLLDEIERSRNMALLAELASGIAHQIRNPLSNLVYGLHLLEQDNIPESDKKELFQTVTERVELMNRMINDFIRYTRMPDLKLSLESINDILKNTLRFFKGWMELANV
ncbi:MAG TPA: histidine kinase dimerization/phospho-acceptor domain-containing protein, partial [Desulfomonilaceae bacterium]|nr:histidine kinase dimerization/phospho-acceptor domain-containing protein [Desulfomonilaceae bacterium]